MTKEILTQRLNELLARKEQIENAYRANQAQGVQILADANACGGAIQLLNELLAAEAIPANVEQFPPKQ